ncbi:hypothetical protein PISMIDRAFT_542018 [Pisolithus microcarpus 441]|uniref:Uncharacterized protein n=1 Tax=Pisolithus microcarpus 441 TaxID=765257 RepID=A0A0C9Z618_9AGAM|nr:hypothetical protein PISMIDRAFT_542018 [Pisolithus microcarpus 441]
MLQSAPPDRTDQFDVYTLAAASANPLQVRHRHSTPPRQWSGHGCRRQVRYRLRRWRRHTTIIGRWNPSSPMGWRETDWPGREKHIS